MRRLVVPVAPALLVLLALPAWAGTTPDGREWPPPASRYKPAGSEIAPGLKIGDRLGAGNADTAKDLLPAEVLAHYEAGRYENEIVDWPEGIMYFDKSFEQATAGNAGKYGLSPEGGIIDEATGKAPDYIYGFPFPKLDPSDPQAGTKAVWNQFFGWWAQGHGYFHSKLVWVSPKQVDREANIDIRYAWYTGQAPKYRLPNPQNFFTQQLNFVMGPADLQGTAALTYRYRDPNKRDSAWTYVPALRRVRAVSPANRSDGFLGSDLSQDDSHYFDAKVEDFEWKTLGVREGLRIVDPDSIAGRGGPMEYFKELDGFRTNWSKNVPAANYMVPGKAGVAWGPASAGLAKRRMWVVEGVPKDRYYLFGRIELWIDAESGQGAWNRKFSWKGELLNTYQVSSFLNYPAQRPGDADVEWMWASQHTFACAENVKLNRATLTGLRQTPEAPLDRRVHHNIEQTFDLQALSRGGK